ncbi:MAG: hypothetical protein RSD95_13260 [Clostridia bacterium]
MNDEYKRGMDAARKRMLRTITDTDKQISAIYREAYQDLARKAAGKKDSSLTKRWQLDMSRSLEERMRQLNGDLMATVIASAKSAGRLPGKANADWLDLVLARTGKPGTGDAFRSVMTRTSDEALRMVVSGQAYLDSKSLSHRIWKTSSQARDGINAIIQQAIAQKKSAYQLAKELEQFVKPGAREDMDWSKVYPDIPHGLLPMYVDKHAQTVARTSINHAYHLAMVEAASKNPFASCIHWALSPQHFDRQVRPFGSDICDEYSLHDEGLGIGNWPIKHVPLPHPRCLCSQYAVVSRTLDECSRELKRWLDGESNPAFDATFNDWKNEMGLGQSASGTAPSTKSQQTSTLATPPTNQRTKLMEQIAQQPWAQSMKTDDREAIYDALSNTSMEELEFFAKNSGKIKGDFYAKDGQSYYSPLSKSVHLNIGRHDERSAAAGYATSDVRVFFHEVGHLFDAQAFDGTQIRLEMGQAYEDAIKRDVKAHANKVLTAAGKPLLKSLSKLTPEQKFTLSMDLSRNPHVKNAVSDITGGVTNNCVVGRYMHQQEDYWQTHTPGVEAIAHMYEATVLKGERLAVMQEYYSEAYKLFTDTMSKLIGGGAP